FTDDTGQSVSALSSATTAVTDITPTLSVTISGSVQEGKTLTATAVANDADAVVTYQWQSRIGSTWTNISGATASTYVVTEAKEGTLVRVTPTSKASDGTAPTANSVATATVTDVPAPLTISNNSITVAAGGSVPLPIRVGSSDGDDTVTVTITGLAS